MSTMATPEAPAPLVLLEKILGSITTQAISVAAQLEIAEVLAGGPLTATQIAEKVGADPDAVYRLLRFLASQSIFAEEHGVFTLTPMARALCPGTPMSMHGIAALLGHPIQWEEWGHLADTVRTGEPSLPKLRGMGAFEYFAANPEYGMVFGAGMADLSDLETAPLVAAYDFARFGKVVDVGGGRGALLAAILQSAPQTRGVLFDDRAVELGAGAVLTEAGVAERCTIESGAFFGAVPRGGDAYIVKHIVHDWPEPQAREILENVHDAIGPDGRLLLMEFVVPEGNEQHISKLVDLWLMLLVGGRERTAQQYSELLASAGFKLVRVVPTASPVSIVEAVPA
jgi:SAM-dependent methyltransferase